MNFLPANRLRIYRDFKAIEAADFRGVIRYYEQNEGDIGVLDFEEYFDCTLAYAEALLETGEHGKHVVMCDHLLEIIIMQNIENWGGEDVFKKILLRKANSLYQMHEYPKAEYVLREAVKIYPNEKPVRRFLEKCLLSQKPAWIMKTRAACVAFMLLAAAVIAAEIFLVTPFLPNWAEWVLMAHNALLTIGVGILVIGESLHVWRCRRAVVSFAEKMQQRKAQL